MSETATADQDHGGTYEWRWECYDRLPYLTIETDRFHAGIGAMKANTGKNAGFELDVVIFDHQTDEYFAWMEEATYKQIIPDIDQTKQRVEDTLDALQEGDT